MQMAQYSLFACKWHNKTSRRVSSLYIFCAFLSAFSWICLCCALSYKRGCHLLSNILQQFVSFGSRCSIIATRCWRPWRSLFLVVANGVYETASNKNELILTQEVVNISINSINVPFHFSVHHVRKTACQVGHACSRVFVIKSWLSKFCSGFGIFTVVSNASLVIWYRLATRQGELTM